MVHITFDTSTTILTCIIVFLAGFVISLLCILLFNARNKTIRKKYHLPPNPDEIDVRKINPTKDYKSPFDKPV